MRVGFADQDLVQLSGRRAAQVLAFLALAPGRQAARSELQRRLWASDGDDARKAVDFTRSKLGLEQWLHDEHGHVRLAGTAADRLRVDVLHFQRLHDAGEHDRALTLVGGGFLERLAAYPDSWLERTRRHWHAEI